MASNIPAAAPADNIETQYFFEDEVLKFDKNGRVKFGLVLETYEIGSSDTDSDFEDVVKKGEIRVAWHPEGYEEVIQEKYIGLADRTLMPGDVVRRIIPGKDTQKGYCREVHVSADVRIKGTSYIAKNVSSERLRPLITMLRDNAVSLDSWVGSTKSINEKLILKAACGSILELRPDQEFCPLKDADTKYRRGFFAGTLFYPGQTLVGHVSALNNAKWINATPEIRTSRRSRTFEVQSVETEGVWVHWQCKALSDGIDGEIKEIQPKSYVTGSDLIKLKRLNLFESCMLQINDKNYLTIEESDILNLTTKSQWRKERSICFDNYKILHNQYKADDLSNKSAIKEQAQCDDKTSTPKFDGEKKVHFTSKIKLGTTNSKHNVSNATFEQDAKKHIETTIAKMFRRFDTAYSRNSDSDGWKTDDESYSCSDSITTGSSCCSSPTPKSSPKRSPLLTKKMKKLKKRNNKKFQYSPPKIDEKVVTETVVVYSNATVVWQDGSIEEGIPSRQLYPIHHLDEHEFFPGDFVLAGNEADDLSYRDYGVIQKVDHQGRTALVKWFRTYTSTDSPRPEFFNETEVSVYDLKDHPDFQYRPGTIVIRVANFIGDDALCTAGQVVDNYAEGCVKVWWVDGHYSMCWPQDLFEVGQYDAEHNFWLSGESDNDSWETESEISEPGSPADPALKPQLSMNLERARIAMAHLEEMFCLNPNLETQEVMRKLLEVYKKCRFMDRLMNTAFFHEDNFMGLIERVRRGSTTTTADRLLDHKNRLFNESTNNKLTSTLSRDNPYSFYSVSVASAPVKETKSVTQKSLPNSTINLKSSTKQKQYKSPKTDFNLDEVEFKQSTKNKPLEDNIISPNSKESTIKVNSSESLTPNESLSYQNKLFGFVITNIDKVTQVTEDIHRLTANQNDAQNTKSTSNSVNDSGNHTKTEWGEASCCSSSDITTDINSSLLKPNDDQTSNSCCSIELGNEDLSEFVCARLSALIKAQLVKALQEINQRFYQPSSLSEVQKFDESENKEIENNEENQINTLSEDILDTSVEEVNNVSTSVIAPVPLECFVVLENAPNTHMFHLTLFHPINAQQFYKAVRFDHKLLSTALPPGVWVRVYEDRMDLLSVMIEGPKKTPYEDGMFLFDIQLGKDYPRAPPLCHYISYCSDRLNPNLYENGKVCISLLGTWSGRGSEVWGTNSTLLQVIVSIQGLILVAEPYFNEAGYEKQKGTQQGTENSRMYNEMVILKLVQSMSKLFINPSDVFREQIEKHFTDCGDAMYNRIKGWMDLSNEYNERNNISTENNKYTTLPLYTNDDTTSHPEPPEFSLVPASRGFCLTLAGLLENFRNKLVTMRKQDA